MEWMKEKETEFKNSSPKQHFTSWMMEQFFKQDTVKKQHDFYTGFSFAISSLIKLYDYPTVTKGIMDANGITLKDLKKAKVPDYDYNIIKKALRE